MVRIGQSAPTRLDDEYTAYVGGRSPWLRQIAYLLCQDWHRADDLVQNGDHRRQTRRADDLDAVRYPWKVRATMVFTGADGETLQRIRVDPPVRTPGPG